VAEVVLNGVPVVPPLVAWAQCAELLQLDDVVALGDALAGRWSRLAEARERSLAELQAVIDGWDGRRGARRLREALELIRANVWSPKETELRLALVRAGLPEPPALNVEFKADDGTWLGIVDMAYPERRLAIEYEGDGHRLDKGQWRSDIARRERFADAGWRTIRVTDDDLVSPRILVARISGHLARRALQ
jgi:hypothetical protein